LNSVHSITKARWTKPDSAHAIVVIGVGLDVPRQYKAFQLTFAEYSHEKQSITGNCFHYNRIEVTRPSTPAKVKYFAFEAPANTYVFLNGVNLVDKTAATSSMGNAFRAPPGAAVYFGDYVLVSHDTVEFERDINAARAGAKELLPRGAVLELAESTTAPDARMFLCTP
jgi:hypothetical protein